MKEREREEKKNKSKIRLEFAFVEDKSTLILSPIVDNVT